MLDEYENVKKKHNFFAHWPPDAKNRL